MQALLPNRLDMARKDLPLKKLPLKLIPFRLPCGRPLRLSAEMWNTLLVFLALDVATSGAEI